MAKNKLDIIIEIQEKNGQALAQLQQNLQGVSAAVKGTGQNTSNLAGTFVKANIATGIITKGLSFLASAGQTALQSIQDLAVKGFNFLLETALSGADLQRLRTVNEVLFKNLPEGVKQTIPSLQAFRDELKAANTTGSNAEKSIQALLRNYELMDDIMAVERGDQTGLSAFMLKVKDLAAAMGISSSEGIDKFTDAIIAGKTESIDALGITGNLANQYRDFAAQLDLTSGELTEAERQQALFNFVMEESIKVEGAYEELKGESAKGINSFRDAIKSAREELGLRMQPVLNTFVQVLITITEGIRDFVTSEKFTAFMATLTDKINAFLTGAGQSFIDWWNNSKETLLPLLGELKGSVESLYNEFVTLTSGVDVNKQEIGSFVTQGLIFAITEGKKFIDMLKMSIQWLQKHPEVIDAVKFGFKFMAVNIIIAMNAFARLTGAIQGTIDKLTFLESKIKSVKGAGGIASGLIGNPLGAIGNKFFASGGIVPGNSYSGDKVIANVNSGEMILNKGQQENLFKMINQGQGGGVTVNVTGNTIDSSNRVDELVMKIKQALAQDNANTRLGLNNMYS